MIKRVFVASVMATGVAVTGCTSSRASAGQPGAGPSPAQNGPSAVRNLRVVESASGVAVSFDDLVARAALTDLVVVGEQHDDPETHFAEFALLEGIGRARKNVVLSLEMFERDVQPFLDDYLAGRFSEAEFLAKSRPWERYTTDYRGLVMLARARGWRVVAANVPRPIASAVSRKGMAAIDTLNPASRAWAAAQFDCPHDAYYARFAREMTGHSAGGGPPTASDSAQAMAMTDRFYQAQCVKDETMAESVVRALKTAGSDAIVVHVTGAFHSDYRQGTVMRVARRLPALRQLVITTVPTATPASEPLGDNARRADYVIFTRQPAP